MKLTTTLLATLIFASTGAIANTTKLTDQDELLIQRAQTIQFNSCVEAQFTKLVAKPELIYDLENVFYGIRDGINSLSIDKGIGITHYPASTFSTNDAAIMLISSCIAPIRN